MNLPIVVAAIGLALGVGINANSQQSSRVLIFKGVERLDNAILKEAVIGYYISEFHNEWEKTYGYRSSTFKKTIPYDMYRNRMHEDSEGWILYEVDILSYSFEFDKKIEENVYLLDISFTDEITNPAAIIERNWSESYGTGKRYRTTNQTIWVFREKRWLCLDCGRRLHMTLNMRFTMK